jgi:hypothetical protein
MNNMHFNGEDLIIILCIRQAAAAKKEGNIAASTPSERGQSGARRWRDPPARERTVPKWFVFQKYVRLLSPPTPSYLSPADALARWAG